MFVPDEAFKISQQCFIKLNLLTNGKAQEFLDADRKQEYAKNGFIYKSIVIVMSLLICDFCTKIGV